MDPSELLAALEGTLRDHDVPDFRIGLATRATEALLTRALVRHDDGSVYVRTGDIPAMWLRDSAAQVRPLLALTPEVPGVAGLAAGVLRTQVEQVLIDPRANAFNDGPTGAAMRRDFPDQSPWIYERKYAVDSLCSPLDLAWQIRQATGSSDHVDARFLEAARVILALWQKEQDHEPESYGFRRRLGRSRGSLSHRGYGAPVGRTGMTWSGFRPSDDACAFGFNIPANALAAVSLERLAALVEGLSDPLARQAGSLAAEIRAGIQRHGIAETAEGPMYAYEVDGLGAELLMDDANVPSLLSLPWIGFCALSSPLYATTRRWALSRANPCWGAGSAIHGIGSRHTRRGWVWPLAVAMEGLTATGEAERQGALRRIEAVALTRGAVPESVHPSNPARFTRRWFSWAEMLYVELVLASIGITRELPARAAGMNRLADVPSNG